MKITVNCPHCEAPLELERPAGPVEASCPACTNSLTIDPARIPESPIAPSAHRSKKGKNSVSGWVIAGYIFAVLGGWLGIAIAVGILMGDKKDKKHGIAMLVISIFSQALWKSAMK